MFIPPNNFRMEPASKERTWALAVLMSVYKIYPNKQDRSLSIKRIREALDRICDGEIDGQPRSQKEALDFLRQKTEEARIQFYGREKKWIPHSSTFYNQSRYLRPAAVNEELPEQLEATIAILAAYPKTPSQAAIRANVQSFMPALKAIDAALKTISMTDLIRRVKLYKECVSEWKKEELQYVPNPQRWFAEQRWRQDESIWRRNISNPSYEDERAQVGRILRS